MKKISIIVTVHNRKACVQNILNQINEQVSTSNSEKIFTILVDDGSTDGTKELIKNNFPPVHLLEGDGFLWWTGGIVKGTEYAIKILDVDFVVWLNDDVFLADNFIENLLNLCANSKYEEMIVGGIVRDKTYPNWIVYSGIRKGKHIHHINCFSSEQELEVSNLNGNIVVVPRLVIDKIGLPDAIKFPQIGADFEYIKRANKFGFKAISTSLLQGTTNYTVADVMRYMPYWMQWCLHPDFCKKYQVVKGLRTMKATQNVHFFINIRNPDLRNVPKWRYELCYLNKLLKILAVNFLPKTSVEAKVYNYLENRGTPEEMIRAVMVQK